ncbi:hypothetical protein ENBRE01_0246 [Enteropsectra breve]|nr:hypothetical protein ENBRE01_0246 [Enteropsectra breve]
MNILIGCETKLHDMPALVELTEVLNAEAHVLKIFRYRDSQETLEPACGTADATGIYDESAIRLLPNIVESDEETFQMVFHKDNSKDTSTIHILVVYNGEHFIECKALGFEKKMHLDCIEAELINIVCGILKYKRAELCDLPIKDAHGNKITPSMPLIVAARPFSSFPERLKYVKDKVQPEWCALEKHAMLCISPILKSLLGSNLFFKARCETGKYYWIRSVAGGFKCYSEKHKLSATQEILLRDAEHKRFQEALSRCTSHISQSIRQLLNSDGQFSKMQKIFSHSVKNLRLSDYNSILNAVKNAPVFYESHPKNAIKCIVEFLQENTPVSSTKKCKYLEIVTAEVPSGSRKNGIKNFFEAQNGSEF